MSTPIDALPEMSIQARTTLSNAGIRTLEQAAELSDADLLALKGFGPSSLQRLRLWAAGEAQPATLDRERESKVFSLYNTLRARGVAPDDAMRSALDEVATFYQKLREAS